jgi:hypothetical protein
MTSSARASSVGDTSIPAFNRNSYFSLIVRLISVPQLSQT